METENSGAADDFSIDEDFSEVQGEKEQNLVAVKLLDDKLSFRPLDLDPAGYFVIFVDFLEKVIVAKHYRNVINSEGYACDPKTGKVIPCDGSYKPEPFQIYRGRSAKEISVDILEKPNLEPSVTFLSHANYLGREFQKAEIALYSNTEYVQD